MSTSTTEQFIQTLQLQIQELKQIIQDQGTLGFTQGRRFIYIQNTKRSLWSFIANDEPVDAVALTGYIIDLYRKEDEIPKLHIAIRTREEEFVLCSGFETHFSRDVMAAIAQLTPQQIRRPLKIMPCLKEIKKADQIKDAGVKKPVYANVLLDDKTLYTYQLKQKLSADELFVQAQTVLHNGAISHQSIPSKPQAVNAKAIAKPKSTPSSASSHKAVDWKAFCCQYGVLPGALKALAQELGLPIGKLNTQQSATLYQHAYSRFVRESVAS